MEYIITINPKNAQAKAFLEYAKKLDFLSVTEKKANVYTNKEEEFRKNLKEALQEAKDIRAGKKKAIPLEDFLNKL